MKQATEQSDSAQGTHWNTAQRRCQVYLLHFAGIFISQPAQLLPLLLLPRLIKFRLTFGWHKGRSISLARRRWKEGSRRQSKPVSQAVEIMAQNKEAVGERGGGVETTGCGLSAAADKM